MDDELENRLADYIRGELPPEEGARMTQQIALNPELNQTADELRRLLALAEQIAQDEPPEELVAEARESLLRELAAREKRHGHHLRLMILQFQGSWGHGEMCLAPEIHDRPGAGVSGCALFTRSSPREVAREGAGQVPLLKLQIQGSWGHGEGCLPDSGGRPRA
jgi:anti-sigma factor RsiW